jgi:CubicO group peptidase (beta-lactamase class C family)
MACLAVERLTSDNQRQVQRFLDDILHRTSLPGISVAMNVNGDTLVAAAGSSDVELNHAMCSDTHFELGCLKQFLVAIVVLELVDKGLVDIEATISYYLPELAGRNGNIIKVRHLLSHTAGYQGENLADPDIIQDYTWQQFSSTFNQREMLFEPGIMFDYNHSASVILGKIIDTVAQSRTGVMVNDLIFKPLNIEVISYDKAVSPDCVKGHVYNPLAVKLQKQAVSKWSEFWSDSLDGPWLKMSDLTKIGTAIVDDSSIFSTTTKSLLLTPMVKLPGQFVGKMSEHPFFLFGLGCARFPNGSYGVRSNSIGQCCALRFHKDYRMVIAVGINLNAASIRDYIIDKLFNAMLSSDAPAISEFYPVPQTMLEMKELVGIYQGPQHHRINLSIEDDNLVLKLGHNPAISHDTRRAVLIFVKDKSNGIVPYRDTVPVPIGFFRHKETMCLMMGVNVYMKSVTKNENSS